MYRNKILYSFFSEKKLTIKSAKLLKAWNTNLLANFHNPPKRDSLWVWFWSVPIFFLSSGFDEVVVSLGDCRFCNVDEISAPFIFSVGTIGNFPSLSSFGAPRNKFCVTSRSSECLSILEKFFSSLREFLSKIWSVAFSALPKCFSIFLESLFWVALCSLLAESLMPLPEFPFGFIIIIIHCSYNIWFKALFRICCN